MGTLIVAAAGCSGDGATFDVEALEVEIAANGSADLEGAVVGDAVCPDDVDVEVGGSFECTLTIDGQDVQFTVTRKSKRYSFRPTTRVSPLPVTDLEQAAAAFVLQNEGLDVAADCGSAERTYLLVSEKTATVCSVDYGGFARALEIEVGRDAEIRDIRWTEAKLDYGVVADRVVQQLVGPLGGTFFLSCPATFADETATAALAPGSTFSCVAVRNFNEIATIEVTVDDVEGAVTAIVVP